MPDSLVYGYVKEPLDLTRMQVHRLPSFNIQKKKPLSVSPSTFSPKSFCSRHRTHDNMITPSLPQHVGDQLGRDRRPALILLVLPSIREMGHDGCHPPRARDLAGVDHDTQLEQGGVDHPGASVHDVDVVVTDGFLDLDL